MEFLEINFLLNPDSSENREILISELDDLGFDSYWEEDDVFRAYIMPVNFTAEKLDELKNRNEELFYFNYTIQNLQERNWNELWERNFEPVQINDQCAVRAPFHKPFPKTPYEIIIEPKMAFGTAHHETTSMILDMMTDMDMDRLSILDMGSGTGVLSIMAKLKNAEKVIAVDNDDWACKNTAENIIINKQDIQIRKGDIDAVHGETFDIILANINRNILLRHMPGYAKMLKKNGQIIFSGFYTEDLESIKGKAAKYGLKLVNIETKNNWIAALFVA
ncbi:MAG: 50S ribosomal protein L11 methyltransferase [Bacteroidales bacterium]|nr:50S ribosomal protein L11 methyltransferase [Bacteroidales bacterium]